MEGAAGCAGGAVFARGRPLAGRRHRARSNGPAPRAAGMSAGAVPGCLLITGGAGFIGANLVRMMAERGLAGHIRVLDDESRGHRQALAPWQVEFVKGDIRDRALLRRVLQGVDAVVHLAAETEVVDSVACPQRSFDVNVGGSFQLLEAMREAGVERLVNASTGGAILGEAPSPVHEEMVCRPTSPYGAGKAAVEVWCSAYAGAYGMKPVSLRFSNVYGPLSFRKGTVVAAFMRRMLAGEALVVYGDGSQTRDYIYVDDICEGIVAALAARNAGVFQLGSGSGTDLERLIDEIVAASGRSARPEIRYRPFRAGEVRHNWTDVSRAREGLGWRPATPLAEGLRRTWAWFAERAGGG